MMKVWECISWIGLGVLIGAFGYAIVRVVYWNLTLWYEALTR